MSQSLPRCRCEEPYPEVAVCRKNAAWIPLIKDLYSGKKSEFTAIGQYQFQSQVLGCKDLEIPQILMGIAMVEMHHLKMLGEAVVLLGGTPDYTTGDRRCWWNGSFVSGQKDLCRALLCDLSDEVNAVDAYLRTAATIDDPRLSPVLRRIALDESCHAELLRDLIRQCRCRK